MKVWGYFRSSAAFRVRIALALKGLDPEQAFVHLRKAEQRAPDYLARNPLGLVPTLEDGPATITQSLAICEYLDETHPEPAFLPEGAADRARVRALAYTIACDIHPINNLRILQYLLKTLKVDKAAHDEWYRHWIAVGFEALEKLLADGKTGKFSHGDTPTLADICLVPQVFNAKRFYADSELAAYPRIMAIFANCLAHAAFQKALPERQPDFEPG
ncbi:MAG: maleylacetoacetate isomerase [Alphaproteobacteria bacterium]|nr:maleylacetoacetate isomerase [Alphaproteobacteria bacterium]